MQAELAAMKAAPAAAAPVPVPPTDQGKPTITPVAIDPFSLPPIARIASGYRK